MRREQWIGLGGVRCFIALCRVRLWFKGIVFSGVMETEKGLEIPPIVPSETGPQGSITDDPPDLQCCNAFHTKAEKNLAHIIPSWIGRCATEPRIGRIDVLQ